MKVLYLAVCLVGLASCDNSQHHVTSHYYVGWVNLPEDMSLNPQDGHGVPIVYSTVVGVGHDDDFILVKRLPKFPDTAHAQYYVVKIQPSGFDYHDPPTTGDGVFGPFGLAEFDSARSALHVSGDIEFTWKY
jgi:hypothetical protein